MSYIVFVDDNFHYHDEDYRRELGQFDTLEEAIAISKMIVDEFLVHAYEPGMPAGQLYAMYIQYGDDPFIIPDTNPSEEEQDNETTGVLFSAWDYAKARAAVMCSDSTLES